MNTLPAAPVEQSRQPVLSLCVPTYGRRKELEECIESILASMRRGGHRIEILVSDNASRDDTWNYLTALGEQHPEIGVYRQERNIGAEGNIYGLVTRAQGSWVWVLGDDDRLEAEAIGKVLSILEQSPPALIMNYSVWNADFSRLIDRARFSTRLAKRYETSDEFIQQFGIETGYCSSLVFRRAIFLATKRADYDVFAPFGFSLLYAFYSGARTFTGFQYLETPTFMNRQANSSGFDWYKYFVSGTTMVLDKLRSEGYSEKAVASAKVSVIARFVLRDILVRRRDGADTSKIFEITHKAYRSFPLFWFGVVPALATPEWLLKSAHRLLRGQRQFRHLLFRTFGASDRSSNG